MYNAYIVTINELRKHSNADRLQVATVFGENVIVDLSYKVGDKCVYFPTDGQLSVEFANDMNLVRKKDENGKNIGGYLEPNKRNIKAINLRGERSNGLILKIDCLSKYTDVSKLKDGDTITVLDGHEICRKYIPYRRHNPNAKYELNKTRPTLKVKYPEFNEHIDTAQLAYNQSAFHEGDIVYLTQKLHGTSQRTSHTKEISIKRRSRLAHALGFRDKVTETWKVVSGTRRTVIKSFENGGFYGSDKFRQRFHDNLVDKLPKGMTVYYEVVGWVNEHTPIMGRCKNSKVKDKYFSELYGEETVFTYGCEPGECEAYIYRITVTNDGIEYDLPTAAAQIWAEKLGMKFVPVLDHFVFTTWDDLNKRCDRYLDFPEPLANGAHVTEGVVVRIENRAKFEAYKIKSWTFRVIEGLVKDEATEPDIEEAQELLDENLDVCNGSKFKLSIR